MRWWLALVFVASGCENLLRLDDIKVHGDGGGDGGDAVGSGCPQVPHGCAPSPFPGPHGQVGDGGLAGLALAAGVPSTWYVLQNGMVASAPVFMNAFQPVGIPGSWQRLALSPDATEMFLGGPAGMWDALWTGTAWAPPTAVNDFPSDGALSTPSSTCGELRMLVVRNNAFEEWARVGGAWQATRMAPLAEPELTGADEQIRDPSLSSDGLVLAFAVSGTTTRSGLWATTRRSIDEAFTTPAIEIVEADTAITTPFLTDDCNDAYYEVGATELFQWYH